ncbi:hypothetical protein [Streptomyces sp. NPDC005303]|uniref:peptidoglycan-binding domain-containing protein n=1 Tax=Streptomyces sp. NPDC005303 TaxID=3155713 RepID=UPI0033B35108
MRTTRRASLASLAAVAALAVPALVVGSPGTASAQVAPKAVAAEAQCTNFTNVSVGGGWYLHVPSVGAGTGNYNCVVVRGMNGLAVLVVQESLNACFGQGIVEDRDFGGNTEQAVRNAQTQINSDWGSHVLDVDGRFGPKTSAKFYFQAYDYSNGQNGRHTGFCYGR